MENAAEALRLAALVLIFVLVLSITMNAFSQARQSVDQIVISSDREYLTEYVEQSPNTLRIVGAESIVPTIYRAYKENYKILFTFKAPNDDYLYIKKHNDGTNEKIYYIDLEKENISDEYLKEYIIKRILFGNDLRTKNPAQWNKYESMVTDIEFNPYGLYNKIKGRTYEEHLGVYFQEEKNGDVTHTTANKSEKRVITYIEK